MHDVPATAQSATPAAPGLIDPFGRQITYLRVSVTDRCDLRCTYCLPKGFKGFEEPANWLRHDEMARLVGLFVELGISKVRLTGGEPLLRRGLADLTGRLSALPGLRDLSLSSNGTQLAQHAAALKQAGVRRLNISLDSLDPACFARITGRDCLASVLDGLMAAKAVGLTPIKLNMVVQPEVNQHEVERLLTFALAQGFVLRLIEPMPIGDTGRATTTLNLSRLGADLAQQHGLMPLLDAQDSGPARYWTTGDNRACFGVITPMSQHFCERCNRVRLGVDGTLYLCLGQEDQVPLGRWLREGASDAELVARIRAAIARKPERHDFQQQPGKIIRFMSQTGG
ncbi:GTP 3',8-cyclase MoaA [Leeia sp.]|uniref:GTP 3',8-cyclase MoaA n=1 Tax=Leeia sp. TaxID=2884678 RepID=UPI0035B0075B